MTSTTPKKIALIIASTRPQRAGPTVASFIHNIISTSPSFASNEITTVDVKSFNLSLYDHPSAPALFPLDKPSPLPESHPAIKWSQTIASFDAYILITPEYNGGLPAGFKNALDYLYHEFKGKPVFVISMGVHGGNFANEEATRALGTIMRGRAVETKVLLVIADEDKLNATMGRVGEKSLEVWGEQKADVLKGFEELVGMLNDGGVKVEKEHIAV
ncbi:flavo protein [Mollisia scopiformis]|uniref:Flavo protein n=1 Tax=Mollisia scopiformis TaxID=149040 RepID=A0A194X0P1_MOLSC|nr:flavo protein [Mollisia scopiformis]KUJ13524.1 flavo protein [Mollisia scopiformis]